jgi:hypothetical protein
LLATLGALLAVLGVLFAESFAADRIHFASDGPLGACAAAYFRLPGTLLGIWQDLNWVGGWFGNAVPNMTNVWLWMLGPVGFSKFYPPLSLLVLGMAVWLCFRRWGFPGWVGLLGAIGAALNTDFFSYACWGLGTLPLSVAWVFLALGALGTGEGPARWLEAVVAGVGVGMSIMEGFDSGAIFSLYVGAYVLFQALGGGWKQCKSWVLGGTRVGLVAACAGVVAAAALGMLIATQVKNVAGMGQDAQSKVQRWEEATAWSLPKIETLRIVVPGLFGYRMDAPEGGGYWGRVGERPGVWPRHSGSGVYGGVVVALVALWALAQAWRGRDGPLTAAERRTVWFWGGAGLVSLLLAWGKYAPFYKIAYALPYFSTIRNPIKFMHPFHLSLVILFGFGLVAMGRLYFDRATKVADSATGTVKRWWAMVQGFERRWVMGLGIAVGVGVLGWLLYLSSRAELEAHLKVAVSPEQAPAIAAFSIAELAWAILFLALGAVWMVLMMSGVLGGALSRWGWLVLGAVLVWDGMRANRPWVYYWSFTDKYATNPIVDLLRDRPYEHRIQALPLNLGPQFDMLRQIYHADWLQHGFPYYNLQSLDVIQDPRPAVENTIYKAAFAGQRESGLMRQWQLTNTRYLLGMAGGMADLLNEKWDPVNKRFREAMAFTLAQEKPGGRILVQTNAQGPFAVLEFKGALPRAKLYSQWLVRTNDEEALQTLTDPQFDPAQTVVLSGPMPQAAPVVTTTNTPAGNVETVGYEPKRIRLKTRTGVPSILLWNDKYDPQWAVTVDGQAQPVLRCNYLMRGVQVPAGDHEIEFRFRVQPTGLYVSLGALALGLVLAGWLYVGERRA